MKKLYEFLLNADPIDLCLAVVVIAIVVRVVYDILKDK